MHPFTLLLAGDVMTGRGIDQALPQAGDPRLFEPSVRDARRYVALAEAAHGPFARPLDPAAIWGDALAAMDRARPDARIVNLETAVTTSAERCRGKEVLYRMHPANVACLTSARIDVACLANNHVLDWGRAGLVETLDVLARAGIRTAGAGADLAAARRPAIVERPAGGRVIVVAIGSTTSGIPADWRAGPGCPGVDVVEFSAEAAADILVRLAAVKQPGDVAVASIHQGPNWGHDVSDSFVSFARRLVEGGVDVVHGHSSHHVRPIHVHRGRLVLFGCGGPARMTPRGSRVRSRRRASGSGAASTSRTTGRSPWSGDVPVGRTVVGDVVRRRVIVTGIVQGVGFRPYVWRRATRLGLSGFVANETGRVVVEVEGPPAAVAAFVATLAVEPPPLARVERADTSDVPATGAAGFAILGSGATSGPATAAPADVATCVACLADVGDPASRRHRHPFATCTDCGPRFTIIESLPYDRAATTMRDFGSCADCAREYADPADRRFHAESIACPRCGPGLWFTRPGPAAVLARSAAMIRDAAALDAARDLVRRGGILAVKGIGGFHLACDATDEAAVVRLRARKGRAAKPLAVMVADVEAARRFATIDEQERTLLESRERPIVLVRKQGEEGSAAALVTAIAPGNDFVGVVLPYSPLHHLLVAGLPPLVMTSGNLAEEPIAHADADAVSRLGHVADAFLLHDRRIHVACDDSLVRCVTGAALPIRRSRGQAPLPIPLVAGGPPVLAVGGELKAAVCVAHDDRGIMGQHVGDVGNIETLEALGRTAHHLLRLCRVEPAAVVGDLHPGYLSTGWARSWAAARGIPFVQVQHHEAHAAALLAEHGLDAAAGPLVVACFDGTGYGRDGTIQGGECFMVEAGHVRHAARLAAFPLPGGDAAIRHPWRVALTLLHAAGLPWDARVPAVRLADDAEVRLLGRQLDRGVACVAATSMGRLFDAVAALVGATQSITYEAEAALNLEALAARATVAGGSYAFDVTAGPPDGPLVVGWQPVVRAVVADVIDGVAPAAIAARFHDAVARLVVAVAERIAPSCPVGLTGGVFQNALLVELTVAALRSAGRETLLHHRVPPNDGGLALGQVVLGRRLVRG